MMASLLVLLVATCLLPACLAQSKSVLSIVHNVKYLVMYYTCRCVANKTRNYVHVVHVHAFCPQWDGHGLAYRDLMYVR